MSRFIGPAHLQSMADTARRRRPRSFMRLSPVNASAGTPMQPKKRNTSLPVTGNCTWKMARGGRVGPRSVFVLPTPVKHDLVNIGNETLRAVAFFAAAMFTQNFDNVMLPPKSHILGTPNREE